MNHTLCRTLPTTQSVAHALAMHDFCRRDTHRRTLLRKSDFARCFPTLFQAGLPGGYYVDATGNQPILGHLRVDVGLDDVARIVQLCHELARRFQQLLGFQRLIAAGQFEIIYLVATDEKARRLSIALDSVAMTGVRCIAVSIPILLDLLAPLWKFIKRGRNNRTKMCRPFRALVMLRPLTQGVALGFRVTSLSGLRKDFKHLHCARSPPAPRNIEPRRDSTPDCQCSAFQTWLNTRRTNLETRKTNSVVLLRRRLLRFLIVTC